MYWIYEQGIHYPCFLYLPVIVSGILELEKHPEKYIKYEARNGYGNIDDAHEALESWRRCIEEQAEEIPIECLYMSW